MKKFEAKKKMNPNLMETDEVKKARIFIQKNEPVISSDDDFDDVELPQDTQNLQDAQHLIPDDDDSQMETNEEKGEEVAIVKPDFMDDKAKDCETKKPGTEILTFLTSRLLI